MKNKWMMQNEIMRNQHVKNGNHHVARGIKRKGNWTWKMRWDEWIDEKWDLTLIWFLNIHSHSPCWTGSLERERKKMKIKGKTTWHVSFPFDKPVNFSFWFLFSESVNVNTTIARRKMINIILFIWWNVVDQWKEITHSTNWSTRQNEAGHELSWFVW